MLKAFLFIQFLLLVQLSEAVHFKIKSRKNDHPVPATIVITEAEPPYAVLDSGIASPDGFYSVELPVLTFKVYCRHEFPNYAPFNHTYDVQSNRDTIVIELDAMIICEMPRPGIEFQLNSYEIDSVSAKVMDLFFEDAQDIEFKKIVLFGFAEEPELKKDPKLAEKRTKAVYDYLSSRWKLNYEIGDPDTLKLKEYEEKKKVYILMDYKIKPGKILINLNVITFKIFDKESLEPLEADVRIKHSETGKIIDSGRSDKNGIYVYESLANKIIAEISRKEYLNEKIRLSYKDNRDTAFAGLTKIKIICCPVIIPVVYFSRHSFKLDSVAVYTLNHLIEFNKANKPGKIEIIGYAEKDELKKDPELGQKRAKAVYDYLKKNSEDTEEIEIGKGWVSNASTPENSAGTRRKVTFRFSVSDPEKIEMRRKESRQIIR